MRMRTNRNPVSALETGFLSIQETRFPKQKPCFQGRRSAFTLLEILLASLIAILLLAALYFAMDMTLRQTAESRDAVDIDNLSRGVFTRVNIDLSGSLGPLPPKSGGNAASSGSSSSSTPTAASADPTMATATTAATDPTAALTAAATDPTAALAAATDAAATPQAADLSFQAGVIGSAKQLTVFVSRLPGTLTSAKGLTEIPGTQLPSDLYRITYWLGQNGGLCRQERPWVTADGVRNSSDPDLSDEVGDTLVQEVTDATFEYFDGSSWLPSWDGTQSSPDGVTPTGPPRAVRLKLTFSIPTTRPGNAPYEHSVEQVIPIRTAPGPNTPAMITPSTDPGTTSSGSTPSAGTGAAASGGSTGGAGAGSGAATGGTSGSAGAAKTSGGATPAAPTTRSPVPTTGGGAKSSGTAAPASTGGGSKGGK